MKKRKKKETTCDSQEPMSASLTIFKQKMN